MIINQISEVIKENPLTAIIYQKELIIYVVCKILHSLNVLNELLRGTGNKWTMLSLRRLTGTKELTTYYPYYAHRTEIIRKRKKYMNFSIYLSSLLNLRHYVNDCDIIRIDISLKLSEIYLPKLFAL